MGGKFAVRGEADLRSILRMDIYSKIQDSNYDLSSSQKYISDWVSTYGDDFRITIQFIIPIALPPSRKVGHCKATIDKVIERLLVISEGYTSRSVDGGWTDGKFLFTEKSILVEAGVRLDLWAEVPEIMARVIDDIQRDLRQKCVYFTVDNIPFGDPIDLLGVSWDRYPDFEQFVEPDPDCLDFLKSNVSDSNDQIDALDITELKISNQMINSNSVVSGGSSSSTASGNVYNYHFGSNQNISEIQRLIANLEFNVEQPDSNLSSVQAVQDIKIQLSQLEVEIDPYQELKHGSKLVSTGNLDQAEGIYKQVLRRMNLEQDNFGKGSVYFYLGYLEMTRGQHKMAIQYHKTSHEHFVEIGDHSRADMTALQIANCLYYEGADREALEYFSKCLTYRIDKGEIQRIYSVQYMLAVYSLVSGNLEKGSEQLNGCISVFERELHSADDCAKMIRLCKINFAWIDYIKGNHEMAISKFEHLLEIESTPRFLSCIHAALGRIFLEIGQIEEAESHHRECVRIRMISGARLGEWYKRHNLTNPNKDWTYPPSDVSYERYDLMCPI